MNKLHLQQKKHTVSIEYCVPCDYSQQALAAVTELVRDYQHVIERLELIMGSKGVFVVTVDGDVIFSKADKKRFPDADELLNEFKRVVGINVEKYARD